MIERSEFLMKKLGGTFNVNDLSAFDEAGIGTVLGAIRTATFVLVIGSEGLAIEENGALSTGAYPLSVSSHSPSDFIKSKVHGAILMTIHAAGLSFEREMPVAIAAALQSARNGFDVW